MGYERVNLGEACGEGKRSGCPLMADFAGATTPGRAVYVLSPDESGAHGSEPGRDPGPAWRHVAGPPDDGFMVSEKLVVATATAEPFGPGPSCACPDETPMFCVACGDHRRMGARGSQDWPCLPVLWLHRQLVPVSPLP